MEKIIAEKIKKRRMELNLIQKDVANAIGVSTQQYQKYETAKNNISAGKLFQISQVLDIDVGLLYPRTNSIKKLKEERQVYNLLNDKELRLINIFSNIKKDSLKEKVLVMAKIVADEEEFLLEEKYD